MRSFLLCTLMALLAACAPAALPLESPLGGLALALDKPNLLFFYTDG
jgi:hypothetical protein